MTEVEHYQKHVATVAVDAPVIEAAELMRSEGVGALVVVTDDGQPAGMVTDRDLVLRVVAEGRDPEDLVVAKVMSQPLVEAAPSDPLERVVQTMQEHHVRRVPVVREKKAVGLVSLDDLLVALASELQDVAETARVEVGAAQRLGRVYEVRKEIEAGLQEAIGHIERVGDRARESVVSELDGVLRRIRNLIG